MKRTKLFFKFLCFGLIFWGVERFCHHKTDGFTVQSVLSDLPPTERWHLAGSAEIDQILSQPFTYLGSGGQSYAFLSRDKKTVLKLFKHHHLKPLFSFSEKKREAVFESCKISYEELREETALLYVHLSKTDHLKRSITLIDKIGIRHTIDLDKLEFVLQKRVSKALREVKKMVRGQQKIEAEKAISSIIEMIATRCEKGIQDQDNGMRRNMGFLEGKAVSIDIGSFSKAPHMRQKSAMRKEIKEKTWRLARFLEKYDRELYERYQKTVDLTVEKKGVPDDPVEELLDQPFSFLGHGQQFDAYIGKDKKSVLKLFRHPQGEASNLSSLFKSVELAFSELKEESGLIAIHLAPTENLFPRITLYGKFGVPRKVELDEVEFVLQKYAAPFCEVLNQKMRRNDIQGAQEQILSLMRTLRKQNGLGIQNTDTAFKRNFGAIGNRAIIIDVGSFHRDERVKQVAQKEIAKTTERLQRWLKKHYPELLSCYEDAKEMD